LVASYGRSFEARNLRRMMQFSEQFPDFGIVSPLTTQLSWTHVVKVSPLKTAKARLFYLGEAATRQVGQHELRRMIDRNALSSVKAVVACCVELEDQFAQLIQCNFDDRH
jgi:hypothetical protein